MFVFWKEKLVIFVVFKIGMMVLVKVLGLIVDIIINDFLEFKYVLFYCYNWFFRLMFEKVCK